MAANDLNVRLPLLVIPLVDGPIKDVVRTFDDARKHIEKPIKSVLGVDTSAIDSAERKLRQLSGAAGRVRAGLPDSASANVALPSSRGGSILSLIPQGGTDAERAANGREERIRDLMDGIAAGLEQRADIEAKIATEARLELEARKRLGLKVARTDASELRDPSRFALRQAEQAALARGREAITDGGDGRASSYGRLAAENARRRARESNGPLGRRGSGAGGGNDEIGGFLKVEDKVGLPGGAKLIGSAGLIAGGVAAGVAAFGELGNQLKAYNDRLSQGASGRDAFVLGLRDLGNKLPIIGGILDGLGNLGAELTGEADKDRKRAKNDQLAADSKAITDYRTRLQQNGKGITDALNGQGFAANDSLRVGAANRADETGRLAAQEQAKIEFEGRQRELNAQEAEIRKKAASTGGDRIDQGAAEKGLSQIAQLRKASAEKLEQDLSKIRIDAAKAETDQRKQVEADAFAVRQAYLQKEGQAVTATLEAADKEAENALRDARERADKAITAAGGDKNIIADINNTLGQQTKTINDRRSVNRSSVIEQAGRDNIATIAGGLTDRAALGDTTAAIEASNLLIDKQTEERRKQLQAIIAQKDTDQKRAQQAQAQLNDLGRLSDEQKRAAKKQTEADEKQRSLDAFGNINGGRIAELRRRSELGVGNQGLAIQADAYEMIQQSKQRQLELERIRDNPLAKSEEKRAAESELGELSGRLEDSIRDLSRARVSASDFANAATTNTMDAGSLTGLALNAKENVQSRMAKIAEDQLKVLKDLLALAKSNNQGPSLGLSY